MKIAGFIVTTSEAFDLLARDADLVEAIEATREEIERLVSYSIIRTHHDYLVQLQQARGGYAGGVQ